ncbi:MAG: cyclic pyranopterin monophosphate synthase MoaC [Gammaproteobacteria bacterium]|nr:cyclic pyranopterin monophosphate synthase MoaC [Gammaproteobacteria bacterium]MDE0365930.1 cyclic pyranopterin monophosphate synthase MoaC [Gammaproteobacteria bacterium]
MGKLSHLDAKGDANMVDVSAKGETRRTAVAEARVAMQPETLAEILDRGVPKGDVLTVARVAGIQAAKRCADLIPLCHPLPLDWVAVEFAAEPPARLCVTAECRVTGPTGVEMEALTAAGIAALTVYDMCKSMDRGMAIEQVRLLRKEGGRSGVWERDGAGA